MIGFGMNPVEDKISSFHSFCYQEQYLILLHQICHVLSQHGGQVPCTSRHNNGNMSILSVLRYLLILPFFYGKIFKIYKNARCFHLVVVLLAIISILFNILSNEILLFRYYLFYDYNKYNRYCKNSIFIIFVNANIQMNISLEIDLELQARLIISH
jgi:hypothetical protein